MGLALRLVESEFAGQGRREHKRSRVMLSAVMMTAAAEVRVVIRDISASGARIDTPLLPDVGSYVTLRRGEISVLGQVVRREGRMVALHFRELIDEDTLFIAIGRRGLVSAH